MRGCVDANPVKKSQRDLGELAKGLPLQNKFYYLCVIKQT